VARCGIVVALWLLLAGNAAAGVGPFQPDVTIRQRGDAISAGDDLYGADAAGQTRSIIVEKRVVIIVRVENDGSGDCSYSVTASPAAPGFEIHYFVGHSRPLRENTGVNGRLDVTNEVLNGEFGFENVRPGEHRALSAVVTTETGAPLGAQQDLLATARSTTEPDQVDAARATITKI